MSLPVCVGALTLNKALYQKLDIYKLWCLQIKTNCVVKETKARQFHELETIKSIR